MRHLFICPEYPPARGGGIGTYVARIADLLAQRGDVVHVIALAAPHAPAGAERSRDGRLVVHRLATRRGSDWKVTRTCAPERTFAHRAARLAEEIIERERIDVIEAQEYYAPLYWLQLRRARGLGPRRRPPCIVHLHSPGERIAEANGDRPGRFARETIRRERFSILAADAVIAPGDEMRRWAVERCGVSADRITCVPYPLGALEPLRRTDATWRHGSVVYLGRLEPRKGVFEWLDAVLRVALEFPEQRFDLIGADTRAGGGSVRRRLRSRIPLVLRDRIRIHDAVPRDRIDAVLASARIAAVPSRWDNFPNTCMEAMASGLPVLGTRTGGIPEMVADGRTGWLAEPGSAHALHVTLRRALATPPDTLADMGEAAAADIRTLCDPQRVVARHVALRRSLRAGTRGRRQTSAALRRVAVLVVALLCMACGGGAGDTTEWRLDTHGDNSARVEHLQNGAMAVRWITTSAEQPWHIQLRGSSFAVQRGVTYRLSFSATAARERALDFAVTQNREPWESLGLYEQRRIAPGWEHYQATFTATADDPDAQVTFNLAADDATVQLANIRVEDVSTGELLLAGGESADTLITRGPELRRLRRIQQEEAASGVYRRQGRPIR